MPNRIGHINAERILWCCNDYDLSPEQLAESLDISETRFNRVLTGEDGLTFKQLRKLARFFNRGVLFFAEPGPVNEARIRTPQFRTLYRQMPDLSPGLKALIERVEEYREIYLGLLDEIENAPTFRPLNVAGMRPARAAANARTWLGLGVNNDFDDYRAAIERKGILVFKSIGYRGQWRIPDESEVIGFSLYHDNCPVIFVKKEQFKSRESFTLMHELGHILLHRSSFIDESDDFASLHGREHAANVFAGHILVPEEFLNQVNTAHYPERVDEIDEWLQPFRRSWGVSSEVILRRLLDAGSIDQRRYESYRQWRSQQPMPISSGGSRKYRHREPRHIFGDRFVRAVFDALHARKISLYKASTYLDNIKIRDVRELEKYVAEL